jgi:hypothetical protein
MATESDQLDFGPLAARCLETISHRPSAPVRNGEKGVKTVKRKGRYKSRSNTGKSDHHPTFDFLCFFCELLI